MLALIAVYATALIIILAVVAVVFSFFWVFLPCRAGSPTQWGVCWSAGGGGERDGIGDPRP